MPLHGEIVVIKRNGTDGTHFPLTATSCLFGRKTECDIRIQLPHVSKEHCKVEVKDSGEVFVTNLSSVNPTRLNGNVVKRPVHLKHGDVITIIDRSFRFEKNPAKQGKRRSTGLDSETFKVFASNQPSDINETVRIETLTSKTQRKSEGNLTKTTHSRRSLQVSASSETRNDLSPFGELYEMLKSKVGAQKENGKTPVKDKGSSPKNTALKRSLQIQDNSQSSIESKRTSRRSQSSDSPVTRPKEVVKSRSASTGRVGEASKSPSRSPKTSSKESLAAKELEQTRRTPSKRASQSVPEEQVIPSVNGSVEKLSPRRSSSKKQSQVITQVLSTPTNTKIPDSSTPQSVPEQPVLKNQGSSPRGKSPTQGRISASKSPKSSQDKPSVTEAKTSTAEPRKSPRKRRSDELSLPDPPPKRKRVSFGGHLSPELFDKRLPPNSPLKKGATPARRSLSLNSPRAVMRKSFGLNHSVIREVFEKSERKSSGKGSPAKPSAKSPSPARRSVSETSPAVSKTNAGLTPVKNSPPKKSPAKTPSTTSTKMTPVKNSPSSKSPGKSPSLTLKKTPLVKTPAKRSPVAKTPSPAKRSPVAKTPSPAKRSPVAKTPSPAKRSPVAKTPSPARRSPVAKTPSPAKRSPVAKTPSPAKRSPVAKTPSPAKRSPVAKTPSPAKRSPVAKTPSPAKRSPVAKTPSPAKRSPVAKTPLVKKSPSSKSPVKSPSVTPKKTPTVKTPAKRSPVAKTPTPAKRSPVAKTPTPAKRSPVAKTPTPAKRSPVAKTPTPAKRSPVAKTPTPAKRSPVAKTPTPAKRSPVKKSPSSKSPVKSPSVTPKKTPTVKTPAKRSPVAKTPTPATPVTPYIKGRFSISRINTPPQEQVPSKLPALQTKISRKSLSMKKTPRRSRKLEAFELIRSRRRSGATEANLLVSKSWADVVKIGVAKTPKKINKPVQKVVPTKKLSKHKTPLKKYKDLTSTGHADSPATILVGRAHTRVVNLTGHVPKVVRNRAVKLDTDHNESFSGVAELFSTPANAKQRKSNRLESSKITSPNSEVVEMSVMQTPEGSGEMVVSPLNSANTTKRKQYSRDAVSRLLQSPASLELQSEELSEETPKSQKGNRKSVGLSGVKRIMRTPKQKGAPVTDRHALGKMLRTPKESDSPRASNRRSANLEVLGIDRLVKRPKQKGLPVEDFTGIQRIVKTPKETVQPVEDFAGVKRVMRTPKEKVQPVEDMIGIKRLMATPKEKSQPVEDMVGIKRLMRTPKVCGQPVEDIIGIKRIMKTPKERGQPVEDIALNHLMNTPVENVQSTESARPIEEIFGIRNLIKTPPKSKAREDITTVPSSRSAQSLGNTSVRRGRLAKRLSLLDDTASGNEAHKIVQSQIEQEPVIQSSQAVKSTQKRGRFSKSQISSSELPKEHVASDADMTSQRRRGRPSSSAVAPKESLSSDAEVTSPSRRGRQSSSAVAPKESLSDAEVTSPSRRGRQSSSAVTPKESLSSDAEVTSPSRRGRQSSSAVTPKESRSSDHEVTSPSRRGRQSASAVAPKESLSSDPEVTSPSRRGRQSSSAVAPKESLSAEVTSPSRRGRQSASAGAPKESLSSDAEVTSTHRGRPKALPENPKETVPIADDKVVSPTRKGRLSTTAEAHKESLLSEATSPKRRGRTSTSSVTNESVLLNSPVSKERPSTTTEVLKESLPVSEVTSSARRGRPQKSVAPVLEVSVPIAQTKLASPARKKKPSILPEISKESVADSARDVTSPNHSEIAKDPTEGKTVLQTRRGRQKSKVDLSQKPSAPEVQVTRGSRSKVAAELSVSVSDELPTTQTRGLRQKATGQAAKVSASTPKVNVSLPTRGSRSKGLVEAPEDSIPVSNDKPVIQKGRGKTKVTDSTQESVSIDSEATAPTRGRQSKVTTEESGPAVEEVTSQRRRGRLRRVDKLEESTGSEDVASSVEEVSAKGTEGISDKVTSPTRKGRSRNTELPKATAPITDEATSTKRRRQPETTEGESDSSQRLSLDANEKTSKSTKKAVRQNVRSAKQIADEHLQTPEPQESIAPVAEKKTQLPPSRGRRKAVQTEPVPSGGDPNSSLKNEQPEALPVQTSPLPRRGGRRKNAEELSSIEPDVAKPKTSKQETRSRGQSKSKSLTEIVVGDLAASKEPVKSPEPKSPKRTARQTKDLVTEPPAESKPKSLRGRPNKSRDLSPEATSLASSETVVSKIEVSQKALPARGRPRTTRDIGNVSVSDADEQTKESSAKQQRGSRRNQRLQKESSASHEDQTKPAASEDTEPKRRGTRGKILDTDEPQSAPEVKGRKNARGKTVQNTDAQTVAKLQAKSVQWHPLLATDIQNTEASSQESNEMSTRGGRSKVKARPDASELQLPVKRSRRGNNQAEAEEIPASTSPESLTVSDVAPPKRGRKAVVHAKDTDEKLANKSTNSAEVVHTSPQRSRRGASSKVVDSENNEVNYVEPSTSRRQRGAMASKTPPENESTQSPVKSKRGGSGKDKADESSTKSTRGVKRKLPNSEAKSAPLDESETPSQASESILVETENIPAGRGRKNQRNTKTQKEVKAAQPEKQSVTSESPAKKRKTEEAPTKRSSRQQTSKLENEKPSAATKTRTSTRSRK
ncbi:serine/arginine repetitive matrix protein 2-like isoform X7 [Bufo gargarizans]|uniref:serine/arginine repetitive matrix protein 2-like isoform X7 n=1 Tax=Bufo gargarizans TaxID=30331 RepID=UPI001CF228A8|nr:serine/arginine repetitive matrix protein 2-like isoform X7 [Bufo gargarizans]